MVDKKSVKKKPAKKVVKKTSVKKSSTKKKPILSKVSAKKAKPAKRATTRKLPVKAAKKTASKKVKPMVQKKKAIRIEYSKILPALGVTLIVLALINVFQLSIAGLLVNQKVIDARENARPADIQLITIQDSQCTDCFSLQSLITTIKSGNVNITSEEVVESTSAKALELISKYGITKLPTVVVTGETNKTSISSLVEVSGALIFTDLQPPYINTSSNSVVGRVSTIMINDSSCVKCAQVGSIIEFLKQNSVEVINETVLERGSSEANELISKYNITILPTLIFSDELGVYSSDIINSLSAIGSFESDGYYVLRQNSPPFVNLTEDRIVGLVNLTVLSHDDCSECFDAYALHMPILQSMGLVFAEELLINHTSAEGESLISEYNITKLPTIIITGDVDSYPRLTGVWSQVGTVEPNDTYIFRDVGLLQQTYMDLTLNETVTP